MNDLTLYRPDGTPVPLGQFCDRPYLLVVFMRHLLCIACNSHLGRVLAARKQLEAKGCSILVVAQAKPELLAQHLGTRRYPVPFACDPDRVAYRAFGLSRTPWWTFLRPDVLLRYLFGMFRGYAPWIPYRGEDVLQLGGDFILDLDGNVVFAYRSKVATDRPSPSQLLAAIPDAPRVDTPAGGA